MTSIKITSVKEKDQEDEQMFLVSKLSNRDGKEDEHDNDDDEEGEEQEAASQAQLLSDMMRITKKGAVQQAVRTSLSTSTMDTSCLLTSLGPSSSLKKVRHSHNLPLTLEKTVAKKLKRAAGYENVAMEANKWAKVVKMRREAEHLHFPLECTTIQLKAVEKAEPLLTRQPLEQEVYALLQGAKLVQEKKETEEEEAVRKALSLQEIRERNRELWRQKEMKRRYEQKAQLMNKSKSRKHHRLLRRERLRKQRAELEELQKTDSEAALERLRELEQARIEERMSLRHKTSKWAHLQGLRATRDKTAMAALQENQRMHQELTFKTTKPVDSDDDDSEGDAAQGEDEGLTTDPFNPWVKNLPGPAKIKGSSPEDESFTRFKKFWDEVNRRKEIDRKIEEEAEKEKEEVKNDENEEEEDDDKEEVEEGDEQEEEEESKKGEKKLQEEEESKADEKSHKSPANPNKAGATKKKESESSDKTATERSPRKRKRNRKERKTIKSLGDEPVNIDDLLDEAEMKIEKQVQKKLKKLGVKRDEPLKEVKTKKKPRKKPSKTTTTAAVSDIQEFDFTSVYNQENVDERQKRFKTLEDLESLKGESVDKLQEAVHTLRKDSAGSTTNTTTQPKEPRLQVDPNKFLQVEAKWLTTALPDNVGETGEALDDEERAEEKVEDVIREAFADDYLMEEFSSEKAEAIKKEQAGSMSLALPGWGDWAGPNIKMSNTKIKKFRLRVPHAPRKDSRIGHVLYNERADVHTNLRRAMVSDLPYPFKSVKDFEASVRAPVGRLFVPEAAHKKLTAPATVTKMGMVIQPMTEDELLRHETPVKNKGKGETSRQTGGGGSKCKATSDTASQKCQKRKLLKAGEKKHS